MSRRVAKLVVCNPRKNALLKSGNKGDAIDARKLAELLRAGSVVAGLSRREQRVGGSASGAQLRDADRGHHARHGAAEGGVSQPGDQLHGQEAVWQRASRRVSGGTRRWRLRRRRAECLYQELDALQQLRRQARRELIVECRKHVAAKCCSRFHFWGRCARRC